MIKFLIEPGYDVKAPVRDFGNAGVDFFIPNRTDTFVKAFNEKNSADNAVIDFDSNDFAIFYAIRAVWLCGKFY
jgi:hypothetical protein